MNQNTLYAIAYIVAEEFECDLEHPEIIKQQYELSDKQLQKVLNYAKEIKENNFTTYIVEVLRGNKYSIYGNYVPPKLFAKYDDALDYYNYSIDVLSYCGELFDYLDGKQNLIYVILKRKINGRVTRHFKEFTIEIRPEQLIK